EVFLLPAAAVAEGDGSFTNTQRLVQFHEKAVDPPDDARTDLWFTYHLGKRLKHLYRHSEEKRDRPIQALLWDYDDPDESAKWRMKDEPSARLVLKEINGYYTVDPAAGAAAVGAVLGADGAEALRAAAAAQAGRQPNLKKAVPLKGLLDFKDDGTTACGAWIY